MGKKEVLPQTKAGSTEERLEELVKNKTLKKCKLIRDGKDRNITITNGEFRSYPDGFEAIGSDDGFTYGLLYSKEKSALFFYDYKKDNELQNLLFKEK